MSIVVTERIEPLQPLTSHRDFMRLWIGQTVSVFGSLLTQIAIPFAAVIQLDASAGQLAILRIAVIFASLLAGFVAGIIVDRILRRRIMIATDLLRAGVVLIVPVAYISDRLSMALLVVVMAAVGALSVSFDVAYQSYLPGLVGRTRLVDANSRMTASSSVAEFAAFSVGGVIVQILTAPIALLVDAFTFLISAFTVNRIESAEQLGVDRDREESVRGGAWTGIREIGAVASLRSLGVVTMALGFSNAVFGVVFLLYAVDDLHFRPGVLGVIFGIGGVGSFVGAVAATKVLDRLGMRKTILTTLVILVFGQMLVVISPAYSLIAVLLLIGQQVTVDPAWTINEIAAVSFRQKITSDEWLGRVNAGFRVLEYGALFVGTILAGLIATRYGVRTALWCASVMPLVAILPILFDFQDLEAEPSSEGLAPEV